LELVAVPVKQQACAAFGQDDVSRSHANVRGPWRARAPGVAVRALRRLHAFRSQRTAVTQWASPKDQCELRGRSGLMKDCRSILRAAGACAWLTACIGIGIVGAPHSACAQAGGFT